MSIFPDDDKRRKRDDDLIDDEQPRRVYDTPPKPNPPHAFEGGTIESPRRSADRSSTRGKSKGGSITTPDGTRIEVDGKQIKLNGKTVGRRSSKQGMSRGWGCLLGLVIALAAGLPIFFFVIGPMFGLFNVFGEDTREVPGDPAAFDPIASYAEIEAYAKGEAASIEFIEMDATYVKSDGTLDLTAESYFPQVTYRFAIPSERPEDAPPIGAGGSTGDYEQLVTIKAFQPGQFRSVTSFSGGTRTTYSYKHLGLERDVDDPTPVAQRETLPVPSCSFAELWETAIQRDAPRDAVAIIKYDDGEYRFSISAVSIYLEFDQSCEVIND
jgi:hypothetical protein